jgi:hypothetical protein
MSVFFLGCAFMFGRTGGMWGAKHGAVKNIRQQVDTQP